MDNIIESRELQVERKHFYIEFRENERGRFLRITEEAHGRRNTIIVPSTGVDEFTGAIAEVIENAERARSEEHTSELQSQSNIVCRLLLEKTNELQPRQESLCTLFAQFVVVSLALSVPESIANFTLVMKLDAGAAVGKSSVAL